MSPACDWFTGASWIESWRLACLGDYGASFVATGLAILLGLLFVIWLVRRGADGMRRVGRPALGLSLLTALSVPAAGLALAVAAGVPALIHVPDTQGRHVIVAVDHSASARRLPEARAAVLEKVAGVIERLLAGQGEATVSIVAFGETATTVVTRGTPLIAARHLREDLPPAGLATDGSSLEAALAEALALAGASAEADSLILVSDGNETTGDAVAVAARLGEAGVPVFAQPLDAGAPSEGIVSAYLPHATEAGATPKARIVFDPGRTAGSGPWALLLKRNGEALGAGEQNLDLVERTRQLALPVRFDGRGVQYVEAGLRRADRQFSTRLFTLVHAPIRVLAHGEAHFLDALSEQDFVVERRPAGLGTLGDYDVVVIDGLPATDFTAARLEEMAGAVRSRGLGLFLVNGPMRGGPEEKTTVHSYKDTPLDPLLPVTADPRFVIDQPPPRDVIIMLDTSGSMGNGGLATAKLAIKSLVAMMRPDDRMQIVTFAARQMGWEKGDGPGRSRIEGFVDGLGIEGASDPSIAFKEAVRQAGNYTAVFLLTDGDLVPYDYNAAGLSFYYLEYGGGSSPSNAQIAAAAREAWMLSPATIVNIQPDFFKPKERAEFFLPEPFVPSPVLSAAPEMDPRITVPGVAISYPRADARRVLVHPTGGGEPVLAFRDVAGAGGGRTGAFLSAFEAAWLGNERGRAAIEAYIKELASWSDRDRYDLRFDDRGSALDVSVTVLAADGHAVAVDRLIAQVAFADATHRINLIADAERPDVFRGTLDLPAGDGPFAGTLIIEEARGDAVASRQVIPIIVPGSRAALQAGSEAATRGTNRALLDAIAERTGGKVDDLSALERDSERRQPPPRPLHPWLLALAGLLFAVAMTGREVKL